MLIKNSIELGKAIKMARKKQKLTQAKLAATSGVGIRFVIDLEKGKPTSALGKAIHIIQMLGIEIELNMPEVSND